MILLLLQHVSVDPNRPDKTNETPLIYTISQNLDKFTDLLLAHPAIDVNRTGGS